MMKISRRAALTGGAALGTSLLAGMRIGGARAAGWEPGDVVELVVGSEAGSGQDIHARTMDKALHETGLVKPPLTIVNKPGAGGAVGLEYLTTRAPDGQTISICNPTLMTTNLLGRSKKSYDDVAGLAVVMQQYSAFAVRSGSPIKSGADLIAMLKKDPKSASIAIGSAVGNQNHIATALAAKAAGINPRDLKVVTLGGSGETITDTIGGHVDVGVTALASFVHHVQSGALRLIAIAAPSREEGEFADVPTWSEILGADVVAGNWYGFMGPKGLAGEQLAFWDGAFAAAVKSPTWQEHLKAGLYTPVYLNSAETEKFFADQHAQLKQTMTDIGLIKS
jgi:putative tricarboxylic transport membrane protein